MTRKDYIAIAEVLRLEVAPDCCEDCLTLVVKELCGLFKRDNSKFDPDRFKEWIYRKD